SRPQFLSREDGIMDELRHQSILRCERKRAYRDPRLADKLAQRATRKAGQLVISYQCYECGMWHIGHADVAEVLARLSPGRPICEICGRIIEVTRLDKARRNGTRIPTCSKRCQLEFDARKASPSNPSTVPKGLPKASS